MRLVPKENWSCRIGDHRRFRWACAPVQFRQPLPSPQKVLKTINRQAFLHPFLYWFTAIVCLSMTRNATITDHRPSYGTARKRLWRPILTPQHIKNATSSLYLRKMTAKLEKTLSNTSQNKDQISNTKLPTMNGQKPILLGLSVRVAVGVGVGLD